MPPPLPIRSSPPGNNLAGSVLTSLGWLALGAAVGITVAAYNLTTNNTNSNNTNDSITTSTRKKKRTYQITEPRGITWEQISRDWDDWEKLPTSFDEETQKLWSTLPVHSKPEDPFHKYENYVEAIIRCKKLPNTQIEQIIRDAPRTFPDDSFFADTDVQDSLCRVLTAIALEYPKVGYTQGMNFIGAFLLLHAKTEDGAFCLFSRLMNHPRLKMEAVYRQGLPLLMSLIQALDRLLARHAPAESARLKSLGVDSLLFAQNWIMTLFTYSMDWQTVSFIWDEFFKYGWIEILRVCVYLVRSQSNKIMSSGLDFEQAFILMRNATEDAPQNVMELAKSNILFDDHDTIMMETVLIELYG
jgi:hypothetical protein